jgi:large subunit ribosomal protein L2
MKHFKPTTPSRRQMSVVDYSVLTKDKKPEKGLTFGFKRNYGRANGMITTRHKGGGNKRLYRLIDFKQDKLGIRGKVSSIEYDPNRGAFIALICYVDGDKRYILAPVGLKEGDEIIYDTNAELKTGNRLPLSKIPVGYMVHNVELQPGKGGQIARGAGVAVQVFAHEGGYANLKMPSSEIRKVSENCAASLGALSNAEHAFANLGKAGKSRHLGHRPTVRGSAMNPCDHPHGGGEGRQPIGLPYPKTPQGKHALGTKTRNKHKFSNKFIVYQRKRKK